MVRYERLTYEQWLKEPDLVLALFSKHFEPEYISIG